MTSDQAVQIADLINARNELTVSYDRDRVLARAGDFEFEERHREVIGCVERRPVQWYQWEVCHLAVRQECVGKGVAYALYQRAVAHAAHEGARVLQCTIREGNIDSERFFTRQGFAKAARFVNQDSGNIVGVWLKSLAEPTA